jgi:hypothetical protein
MIKIIFISLTGDHNAMMLGKVRPGCRILSYLTWFVLHEDNTQGRILFRKCKDCTVDEFGKVLSEFCKATLALEY